MPELFTNAEINITIINSTYKKKDFINFYLQKHQEWDNKKNCYNWAKWETYECHGTTN